MSITKIEIERFSTTTPKPFEDVVDALNLLHSVGEIGELKPLDTYFTNSLLTQ